LIRLYTDNLSLTVERFGKAAYIAGNTIVLFVLTLLFQSQWLQIQWVGTVVIGMYVACLLYVLLVKRDTLSGVDGHRLPAE
jgi:hypothetical protein